MQLGQGLFSKIECPAVEVALKTQCALILSVGGTGLKGVPRCVESLKNCFVWPA